MHPLAEVYALLAWYAYNRLWSECTNTQKATIVTAYQNAETGALSEF